MSARLLTTTSKCVSSLLDHAHHFLTRRAARKREDQEKAETEKRSEGSVPFPLSYRQPSSPTYVPLVMLLGQAESGKSTLQKQFQLYHASQTLDRERPSWRPIVYFNTIKAVRSILDELDWDFTTNQEDEAYIDSNWPTQISRIRHKLLPLVSLEDSLASELSGGVTVAGGRSGVFVRSGWQSVVTSTRSWPVATLSGGSSSRPDVVANMAARLLSELQYDVDELWQHLAVKTLLRMRRLRLDESAALCVQSSARSVPQAHIVV